MRLNEIKIDAYGVLADWSAESLSDHNILVLCGDNESGKTCFLEFLTTILFGFKPTDPAKHPYMPWTGRSIQGHAGIFLKGGEQAVVARRLRSSADGSLTIGGAEERLANRPVPWVGSISREMYRSLFALTLEEATNLSEDMWSKVEDRLLGGAAFSFLNSAREAIEALETRANNLWRRDRRGKPRYRLIEEMIREVQNDRQAAISDDSRIREIETLLVGLDVEIKAVKEDIVDKKARLERAEILLPVLRRVQEIERLREMARAIPEEYEFPENPSECIEQLEEKDIELGERLDALNEEIEMLLEKRNLTEAETRFIENDSRIRQAYTEQSAYAMDINRVSDMQREQLRLEGKIAEQVARLFLEKPEEVDLLKMGQVSVAELSGRIREREERIDSLAEAKKEAGRLKRIAEESRADVVSLPSDQEISALRERRTKLKQLNKLEAQRDQAKIFEEIPEGAKQERWPKLFAAVMIIMAVVFAIISATGTFDNRILTAAIAAVFLAIGVAVFFFSKREIETPAYRGIFGKLAEECRQLRSHLGVSPEANIDEIITESEKALLEYERLPQKLAKAEADEKAAQTAQDEVEDSLARVKAAGDYLKQLFDGIQIAPAVLDGPGQELLMRANDLQKLVADKYNLEQDKKLAEERIRRREEEVRELAEVLEVEIGDRPMDMPPIWIGELGIANIRAKEAADAKGILPTKEEEREGLVDKRVQIGKEKEGLILRLYALDEEGNDFKRGIQILAEVRDARIRADELEKALYRENPDWKERYDEAKALEDAGESLDLSQEEKIRIRDDVSQLEEEKLADMQRERGSLDQEKGTLEAEKGVAFYDGALESYEEEKRNICFQRDQLAVLSEIIKEADRRYREENQPPVLSKASEYIQRITRGKYTTLAVDEGGDGLQLTIRESGEQIPHVVNEPLSRGIREQVYLSLRFALAEHIEADEPLPIVLDEVFVNWDPERTSQGMGILKHIADDRQIVILTCHPELSDRLEREAGAKIIYM